MMHDVHTRTPVLKALRTTITLAKRRDGRHRLRDSALHGITATVAHANLDEAMRFSPQGGLLPEAHHGTRMASKRRRQKHRRIPGTHGWTASKATPGVFRRRDHAGQYRCRGNVIMTEGSNEAVQLGRFSLKEVELNCNVKDLTTKRHDRERRNVSMTLVGLRYTRGRGNAVSTASEG